MSGVQVNHALSMYIEYTGVLE